MSSRREVPFLQAAAPPPARPGDVRDAQEAGDALRRACLVDGLREVALRLGVGALSCVLLGFAARSWWSWHPTAVSVLLASLVVGVFAVAFPLRTYRAAVQDADSLRPGRVVAAPRPGRIVVRGVSGAVWCWTYRGRFGMREVVPGERVWTTGGGRSLDRSPALVLATPFRAGEHVLWPTRARHCERVPDPQSDREAEAHLSYEDEHLS